MKEHFTSRVGRVDDVDKRAAFESTACTHSPLALLADQKVEKNSARDHRSERASASERVPRFDSKGDFAENVQKPTLTNEQTLQHNMGEWTDAGGGEAACSTCFVVEPLVRSEKCLVALDADRLGKTWVKAWRSSNECERGMCTSLGG